MSDPSTPARIGEVLGGYLLLSPLTREPRRTFFALRLEGLEEVTVAVAPDPGDGGSRFRLEAEAIKRARDPALPRLIEGRSLEDGRSLVASRFVAGASLATVLGRGALEADAAMRVLGTLAQALVALHGKGLIHGDLHPSNVLVTPEGELHLVGFVPRPVGRPASTRPDGAAVQRYASPEWNKDGVLSSEGDLYALGLVAYELFAGRALFREETRSSAHDRQRELQVAISKARSLTRSLPPALGPVLSSLLDIDPNKRTGGAERLVDTLASCLPANVRKLSLRAVLGKRLARALGSTTRRMVREAREHLTEGRGLPACASLHLAAQTGSDDSWVPTMREALWETREMATRGEAPDEVDAACLQLLRAGALRECTDLLPALRMRIQSGARADGILAPVVAGMPPVEDIPESLDYCRNRLLQDPSDEGALLLLACLTDDVTPETVGGRAGAKASVLMASDLPGAAVYHLSRALRKDPQDRGLLARIGELATEASGREAVAVRDLELGLEALPSIVSDVESAVSSAGSNEEAEVLLMRGQLLAAEGEIEEAAQTFSQLLDTHTLESNRFQNAVTAQLHQLLWAVLLPGASPKEAQHRARSLLVLAQRLELDALRVLCERLLFQACPGDDWPLLLDYSREFPQACPFLRALAQAPEDEVDRVDRYTSLVSWGWALLAAGEVMRASECFVRAKTMGVETDRGVEGIERVLDEGAALAEVADEFLRIEDFCQTADLDRGAAAVDAFLRDHPHFEAAIELRIRLSEDQGDRLLAAESALTLARRCLARGELDAARELFRLVLRNDPLAEEPLLHLATWHQDDPGAPSNAKDFKLHVLESEGLAEVAIQRLRHQLTGTDADVRVQEKLVRLCRTAGQDPSRYLVALARHAAGRGAASDARGFLDQALAEAHDPASLTEAVRSVPGGEGALQAAGLA